MEIIGVVSAVFSIVMIVTFFNMASRLKEIRDEIMKLRSVTINHQATARYWGDKYRAAKLLGDKQEMVKSLKMFVYYKIKRVPVNEKQNELKVLHEEYSHVFHELGTSFPEWDKSIFK